MERGTAHLAQPNQAGPTAQCGDQKKKPFCLLQLVHSSPPSVRVGTCFGARMGAKWMGDHVSQAAKVHRRTSHIVIISQVVEMINEILWEWEREREGVAFFSSHMMHLWERERERRVSIFRICVKRCFCLGLGIKQVD